MKRCQEVVPLLGPPIDGALPDDDLAWVDDHLRGCASCTDRKALFVAQGDALREVLSARGAAADFTGFAGRVLARVGNDRAGPPLRAYGSELWGVHKRAFAAAGGPSPPRRPARGGGGASPPAPLPRPPAPPPRAPPTPS